MGIGIADWTYTSQRTLILITTWTERNDTAHSSKPITEQFAAAARWSPFHQLISPEAALLFSPKTRASYT